MLAAFLLLVLTGVPALGASGTEAPSHGGIAEHSSGDFEQTVEALRQAYRARPDSVQIRRNLALAILGQARSLMRQGQPRAAADLLFEAEELAPDDPVFRIDRAHALVAARAYDEAEVELNELLGLDEKLASAWLLLGRVYYYTDRVGEAIEAWQRSLAIEPGNPWLQKMLDKARREYLVEKDQARDYASSFILSYDDDRHADLGDAILDILNQAYIDVGSKLDSYPPGQIPVLVYTREEFSRVTVSPGWAAGLYDGKIRVPVGGITRLDAPLKAVLFHEYTHVVVRELAGPRCPTWLNEGLAEVVGRSQFDPPLQALEAAPRLLDFSSLEGNWQGLAADRARLAYEQSYSFVRYLVEDYGWYLVGDLLRYLGRGLQVSDAFSRSFASYGVGLEELRAGWLQSLGRPTE